MSTLTSLSYLETISIMVSLGIASLATWTVNRHIERSRRLGRDLHLMRAELDLLRVASPRSRLAPEAPALVEVPEVEPLTERLETIPPDPEPVPFGRLDPTGDPPGVEAIASQLSQQSPEAIANLLGGRLGLGEAAQQLGIGRQEARLLAWLHRGSDVRPPHV